MIGFVDDAKSQVNSFQESPQPQPSEVIKSIVKDAQVWSDILRVTGGALKHSKCSYHMISWFLSRDICIWKVIATLWHLVH